MKQLRTLLLPMILIVQAASAEHLPGGNITYVCLGGGEYQITLTLFRDCGGVPLMSQQLRFANDCGSSFTMPALPVGTGTEVSQLCPAQLPQSSCNGGNLPGIEVYQVQTSVFLGPCNAWTISWNECCRSDSQNLVGNPGTYIESRLNSATVECNSSPVFTQNVVPYVCVNEPVNYNLAVTEPDGHQLRYRLVTARHQYPPVNVNYMTGLSGAQPYPGLAIDSLSGQITFTPTAQGKIYVVVRVDEYLANGVWVGSVLRDLPFEVIACSNIAPDPLAGEITAPEGDLLEWDDMSITMCTYGTFCFNATFTDEDAGQALTLTSNVATVLPGASFITTGSNPVTATICWGGSALESGTYGFVITAEDNACPTTGITSYTYSLTLLPDMEGDCLGTAVAKADQHMLKVWPTPAHDVLHVRHSEGMAGRVDILDAHGRTVISTWLPSGSGALDVSALATGSYLVNGVFGPAVLRQKLLIHR